jgi:hypothetical protein
MHFTDAAAVIGRKGVRTIFEFFGDGLDLYWKF